MGKKRIRTLCRQGIFVAMYVVLTMLSLRAGNLRVTFASLPVTVAALLFGPGEAAVVALVGEFLNQLLHYGLGPTTVLWVIPPATRGVLIGVAALWTYRRGRTLEERPVVCYGVCTGVALLTTAVNTLVIYLDSVILKYYTVAYVFGGLPARIVGALVTALAVTTISIPLVRTLRQQGVGMQLA